MKMAHPRIPHYGKCPPPPTQSGHVVYFSVFRQTDYSETSIKKTTLGPRKCLPFWEVSALHRLISCREFERSRRKRNIFLFSSFCISNICPVMKQNENIHLLRILKLLQFSKSVFFVCPLYRGPF